LVVYSIMCYNQIAGRAWKPDVVVSVMAVLQTNCPSKLKGDSMKKKLRDMKVGDRFKDYTVRAFINTVDYVGDKYVVVYIEEVDGYKLFLHGDTEYEMVEPEPKWLYECTVTKFGGKLTFCNELQMLHGLGYKIKGGRKIHPDTWEIT